MRYRLCTNGQAVLLTRELRMLDEDLCIELEGVESGYTVIIKSGENTFYRPVIEGVAILAKKHICPGVLELMVVKDDEAKLVYTCDELYSVAKDGYVAICGNTLEYDKLLTEMRAEMDGLRAQMREFKAELLQFRDDFDDIYAGTEII